MSGLAAVQNSEGRRGWSRLVASCVAVLGLLAALVVGVGGPAVAATEDLTPSRIIAGDATELVQPEGVAVLADGRLAVVDVGSDRVLIFAAGANGNVAPAAIIDPDVESLSGVARLSTGELAVTSFDAVTMFAEDEAGVFQQVRQISGLFTGSAVTEGVAELGDGSLAVTNLYSEVLIFDANADGDVPPIRSIVGGQNGLEEPAAVARWYGDPADDGAVVVADFFGSDLLVFSGDADGDMPPSRTIGAGALDFPTGVAADPGNGQLLVVSDEGVQVFARDAGPEDPPVRTVAGPNTGLEDAWGIASLADGGGFAVSGGGDLESPDVEGWVRVFAARPGAPSGLSAVGGYEQAVVSFTPGADGGSAVTGFEASVDGGPWVPVFTPVGAAVEPAAGVVSVVVPDLTNGVPVSVALRAVNEVLASAPSEPVEVTPLGAVYVGLEESVRVFDSRESVPVGAAPVVVEVDAPVGSVAVAYNVTVVDTTAQGNVVVGPAGEPVVDQTSSTLNWFAPGQRWANSYVSALGDEGNVQVASRGGEVEVIVDVLGYYIPEADLVATGAAAGAVVVPSGVTRAVFPASVFTAVDPVRVFDSRAGVGPIGAGQSQVVDAGSAVSEGAVSVAYTLTVADTKGQGHLSVGLPGEAKPATSVINWFVEGQRIANSATAAVNSAGEFEVFGAGPGTEFIVDVVGYFTQVSAPSGVVGAGDKAVVEEKVTPAGLRFTGVSPTRVYDSRDGDGPIVGGQDRTSLIIPEGEGVPVVPEGVGAVAFNVTEFDTVGVGHLRVTGSGQPAPSASTINWYTSGMRLANGTAVQTVGDAVTVYARGPQTGYTLDIAGYYN